MTHYWYDNCPLCEQGRLFIFEDATHGRLYLHCDECEQGWLDPERAHEKDAGFLTLLQDFEAKAPDLDTIKRSGWEKYALHSDDE